MSKSIQTQRLVLRQFQRGDAAQITALIGNLSVSRWLTRVPHPYHQADAHEYIDHHVESEKTLAVTVSDELIGSCAIGTELGYWLGQPFWGRGYMSEAAAALVGRHFQSGRNDLTASHMLGNLASAKILSKLGFTPTHKDEAVCSALGRIVTLQKMQLTHSAWEARA